MKMSPTTIATAAVRAARLAVHAGATVRTWAVASHGRTIYLRCITNGQKFTVRVSDHRSRDIDSPHPYYFVRLDRPHLPGLYGLPGYVRRLREGAGRG